MGVDIYREEVLDHYQNPRNQGEIEDECLEGREANASCGDMISFQIKVEKGKIVKVKWKGLGCAVSTASSSKLSEWLMGKDIGTLKEMSEEDMLGEAVGWKVGPGRQKCLSLPVRVVKKVIF